MTQALTESRNPRTMYIDRLSSREAVKVFVTEDKTVSGAVEACSDSIALAAEYAVSSFKSGGRLIYIGAGTSGRLGVLDAAECPPTFGVPSDMVVGLIAGGKEAMFCAVEGAEDDPNGGQADLAKIRFSSSDFLVGISASGSTPYVLGALKYARSQGAKTALLTCNPYGEMPPVDVLINPVVGPEVITGSTRLKSGTACKMVLNMISSISMIKCGKVFENLMVDVKTSNAKLKKRALQIVMDGAQIPNYQAEAKLIEAKGDVKLAILMSRSDIGYEAAKRRLSEAEGVLYKALGEHDYE